MSGIEDDYYLHTKVTESNNDNLVESFYRQETDSEENHSEDGANQESDSDDIGREKNELELLREENIKKANEFLRMLMKDPEYADVLATAKELKPPKARRIKNPSKDPSFRSCARSFIPLERRRSCRLQNIAPVYFKEDLIDEYDFNRKRRRVDDNEYFDLETIIYRPKKSRSSAQNVVRTDIIPIEDITDQMIGNIARKGTVKVYSVAGTSCHQCRQKTTDQKTCCRNVKCFGVRGQFCGVCLENRYGEDVAVALKDPQWNCPVCRCICNCSFCRQKAGKRPTGILAPIAQQSGHKSVKDFLDSLKGEGDYAHQDSLYQKMNNPKYLLGFSKDGKVAHMGGNANHRIKHFLNSETLKKYIQEKENKLETKIEIHDDPPSLLGFVEGTDIALLEDGTRCHLGPTYSQKDQFHEIKVEINSYM